MVQPSSDEGASQARKETAAAKACTSFKLKLVRSDVDACALENWYARFSGKKVDERGDAESGYTNSSSIRGLSSSGMKTVASAWIPLPDDFIAYLGADGIILPDVPGGDASTLRPTDPRRPVQRDTLDDDSDDEFDSGEEDQGNKVCFPELECAINSLLDDLRWEAFTKLNWTAPRDAFGSLKVSSPGEIYMLLKSSDFAQYDLSHAYDNCFDKLDSTQSIAPKLVLRRWCNLDKSMEFRCFCIKRQLISIVQRYPQTFQEYLLPNGDVGSKIVSMVTTFFQNANISAGPSETCENFVFDVYVDRNQKVWLLDFGPLPEIVAESDCQDWTSEQNQCSDSLLETPPHELLSWSALHKLAEQTYSISQETSDSLPPLPPPTYVFVESRKQASSMVDVIGSHRVPIELVTGELTQDIIDMAKAQLEKTG